MKSKLNYRKYIIFFLAIICLCLGLCIGIKVHRIKAQKSSGLYITNLNVYGGDAAVIECGKIVGIIDAGPVEASEIIDDYLKDNKISSISFLILTHYDQDHIGGAIDLIKKYDIEKIFIPDYVSQKKYYAKLMKVLADNSNVDVVSEKQSFDCGKLSIVIIPAGDSSVYMENENNVDNNMSLVAKVVYQDKSFLFTGDIEKKRIKELLDSGIDLSCDWIKMPHHGRYQKKVGNLLDAASPQYAIITCSAEEGLEPETMDLLDRAGVQVFYTMTQDVVTICDDEGIRITSR